jgi:tetratricopeptide (TPR) repeat protein
MGEDKKKEHQLDDIKEIRKLVIRSLNSVNGLESAINQISQKVSRKDQGEANKFYFSFVLLGIIIILAFFFYFRAEVSSYSEKYNLLEQHQQYLKKEIEDFKEKLITIENNNIKAYNLYLTLKEGNPDKAFKMYSGFNLSALSRLERMVIDSEMSLIRQKAALNKFEEGETLFKRKSYGAAIERFDESLEISTTGDHIPTLFYLTALSYYRTKNYNNAAIAFDRFLFVNTKKGYEKDKAELLLGVSYERMRQYERARNFYVQVLKENRYNRYHPTMRDRIKLLEKRIEKQED